MKNGKITLVTFVSLALAAAGCGGGGGGGGAPVATAFPETAGVTHQLQPATTAPPAQAPTPSQTSGAPSTPASAPSAPSSPPAPSQPPSMPPPASSGSGVPSSSGWMSEEEEVAWINSLGFKTTVAELRASYSKFQPKAVPAGISVLWDTETDDCRNYLRLYQRTNHRPFYDQAKIWRDFYVNTYSHPGGGRSTIEQSHVYLMGLIDWWLVHQDAATLAAIDRIVDFIVKVDPRFIETRVTGRCVECLAYYAEKVRGSKQAAVLAKLRDFIAGFNAAPRVNAFVCLKFLTSDVLTINDLPAGTDIRKLFPRSAAAGVAVSANGFAVKGHLGAGLYQDCTLMHGLHIAARALGDSNLASASLQMAARWTALSGQPFYDPEGKTRNAIVPYYVLADAPELDMFRYVTPSTPLYVQQFAPFCTDPALKAQLSRQSLLRAYGEQNKLAPSELGKPPRFYPWQVWEAGYFLTQK